VYAKAGFADIRTELFARPTPVPAGIAAWVTTFRAAYMDDVAPVDQPGFAGAVERRLESTLRDGEGVWIADYVRLRFSMRKPL
jgi:hypothetical protein